MLFDRPIGPWRATTRDACNDAIARRLGSRERWATVTYLSVGVWLQGSRETTETEGDIESARRALWKTERQTVELAHAPAGRAVEERRPKVPLYRFRKYRSSRG
jgi:hypothetical protein